MSTVFTHLQRRQRSLTEDRPEADRTADIWVIRVQKRSLTLNSRGETAP